MKRHTLETSHTHRIRKKKKERQRGKGERERGDNSELRKPESEREKETPRTKKITRRWSRQRHFAASSVGLMVLEEQIDYT